MAVAAGLRVEIVLGLDGERYLDDATGVAILRNSRLDRRKANTLERISSAVLVLHAIAPSTSCLRRPPYWKVASLRKSIEYKVQV